MAWWLPPLVAIRLEAFDQNAFDQNAGNTGEELMSVPAYALTTRQQLSVSPRLQQAVRLLQMSTLEFTQELQQALASNPFLDEDPPPEAAPENPEEAATEAAAAEAVVEPLAPGAEDFDLPEAAFAPTSHHSDEDNGDPRDWACAESNLRDHLRAQLCGQGIGERERLAAEVVIETLDDDGYLRQDPVEAAAALPLPQPLSAAEIETGIRVVQELDPPGIGARSLGECLALQLAALDPEVPGRALAIAITHGHLEALARHDYGGLQQRLDCSLPALREAHALIRHLDPKPGNRFASGQSDYVVPDVIVLGVGNRLCAIVNPAVLPRARLNRAYVDLFRRARAGGNPAMSQQLREARWLLKNVEQRFATIKRVADAIIARQRAFFSYGEIALKPLVLREIAEELGLHESTVSRATGNKYMATPRGLFEFKHFFSRQLTTGTGGTCSAAAVRALMKEMIEAENVEDPLSDVTLAQMLTQQGICVARRTVAKYRNLMKLPPAELRRHG